MTGAEVATVDRSAELDPAEQRRMNGLYRLATRFAASDLVPKELKGKPDSVLFLILQGEQYGLSPARSLSDLWIINGRVEPSAQVRIAVAMARGHEVRTEETSSECCVIAVRRRGSDFWQRLTYTIDDARRAGALDEWVERWVKTQSGKSYKETFVLGTTPVPDWAQKLIAAGGNIKRREVWHSWPSDMLFAAAARRATKRFCPDAFINLGLTLSDDDVTHPADFGEPDVHAELGAAGGEELDQVDDDEPAEAEVVQAGEEAASGSSTRSEGDETGSPPEPPLAGAAFVVRGFATAVREAEVDGRRLDDADRHALVAHATGGRTSSTREVHRAEAPACFDTLNAVLEGTLRLVNVDGARRVEGR